MEHYHLDRDIRLICLRASSFPTGVANAHQRLHSLLPATQRRMIYGISWPDGKGSLIYMAGVEETYPGETEQLGGETFIVKKGTYSSILIHNYMSNMSAFGQAFKQLTADPAIDPQGACVEMYLSEVDVRCMVRLALAPAQHQ